MNIQSFWFYPYNQIPHGHQIIISNPIDWASILGVLIAALIGAYFGSHFSHKLAERRENNNRKQSEIYEINIAIYKLSQQWRHTWEVFNQHIWSYYYSKHRVVSISQLPVQTSKENLYELEKLGFLLSKSNKLKNVFLKLSSAQDNYKRFIDALNTRSENHLRFQNIVESSGALNKEGLSLDELSELSGPLLWKNLNTSTDFMIEMAEIVLLEHLDINDEFVSNMKEMYPKAELTKFQISSNHQKKYGEIRDLLIQERKERDEQPSKPNDCKQP